jgi:hypothetical protein
VSLGLEVFHVESHVTEHDLESLLDPRVTHVHGSLLRVGLDALQLLDKLLVLHITICFGVGEQLHHHLLHELVIRLLFVLLLTSLLALQQLLIGWFNG